MPPRKTRDNAETPQATLHRGRRKTIPAHKVGFTLTISEKAMKEIDRIEEEAIKAARDDRKFAWR